MVFSETLNQNQVSANGFSHSSYLPSSKFSPSWFDLRVFYVRVSNFVVDESTPEFLTLNHIPLDPDTLLEVNGSRCSIHSDGMPSLLRRDRVDKKSKEATFVSTDSIRFTGSVKFEVFNTKELVLSGVLEMLSSNGPIGESKESDRRWSVSCDSEIVPGTGFLKGKYNGGPEYSALAIEVYVAGSFSGAPIILTRALQLSSRKKNNRKATLDAIPEYETAGSSQSDAHLESSVPSGFDLQTCY